MLQDIEPYRLDNAYRDWKPRPQDHAVVAVDDAVVVMLADDADFASGGEAWRLPTFSEIEALGEAQSDARYLFAMRNEQGNAAEEMRVFLLSIDTSMNEAVARRLTGDDALQSKGIIVSERDLHALQHGPTSFGGLFGLQLKRWYDTTRFCGRCGAKLEHSATERMMFCPKCHDMTYPTISPAVIVAVTNGDDVLVARGKGRPKTALSLIAGFAEVGETIEQTVQREVMEETGVRVKNLRFYKSQPWPLSSSLLCGFFAELDGDPKVTCQEEELDWAGWMDRRDLQPDDTNYSLTREMMEVLRTRR